MMGGQNQCFFCVLVYIRRQSRVDKDGPEPPLRQAAILFCKKFVLLFFIVQNKTKVIFYRKIRNLLLYIFTNNTFSFVVETLKKVFFVRWSLVYDENPPKKLIIGKM